MIFFKDCIVTPTFLKKTLVDGRTVDLGRKERNDVNETVRTFVEREGGTKAGRAKIYAKSQLTL